ncbi:MAG: helix-turn-helix transcriptional regulator [Clostridia bacterium]|nr:helix-turn-helix transcriptional regulator [Clostridia bacterium]MBR3144414.1 helix-turn-helix transcriptional regulator [Clostridia bacterium]
MNKTYERIEELCKQKNISVTALCKACGISRAVLTDFKMGRQKSLSAEILSKIADYFSVSVDYLLGAPVTPADEQSLKVALFGGDTQVTDEMWDEVKRYAAFIKERKNGNK